MATEFTVTVAAVQQRAANTLAAGLAASGYNASPWIYQALPTGTLEFGHKVYGVGILDARPVDSLGKQRPGVPLNSVATVGVRIQYFLRPESAVADHVSALLISDLATAVMIDTADSDGNNAKQKWRWDRTRFSLVGDGTFLLIDQTFTCWFHTSNTL